MDGDVHAVPGHAMDLWLATEAGLYHSTDAGASFLKDQRIESASKVGFGRAAPGRAYPTIFFNGRLREGLEVSAYGFYRSDDGGKSWIRINDDQHQYGRINSITGDPRVFGRVYIASDSRGVLFGQPDGAAATH